MRYILLGATGDLSRKKILPALARLAAGGREVELVASSRRPWGDAEYRAFIQPPLVEAGIKNPDAFLAATRYCPADHAEPGSLAILARKITPGSLVHLAIQPSAYVPVIRALGGASAFRSTDIKLLIEKPFGVSEASALELESAIERYLPASAIYRVDHYLGKDTVRALSRARLGKSPLQGILLFLSEVADVLDRGAFYDETGVIRDVVQSHALEVLATALAESDTPEARLDVLNRLSLAKSSEMSVRQGQYRGYLTAPGVADGSVTPTAVELNFSYADVGGPVAITIYAGKALARSRQELVAATTLGERLFSLAGDGAYDRLIEEASSGDSRHFPALEETFATWRLIDPVQAALASLPLIAYERGANF